jgi:hypothetical protein
MSVSIPFTPSPQWLRDRKEQTARFNRLLRFKFSDMWRARHRGCSFISDDDEGRLMLMLLLRFRTTTESAMEMAPWLKSEREVKALRKAGHKLEWRKIGELLKLTYAERRAHKLYHWLPVDVPPEEVRRRQSQRNKEKDRERKRKARAKNKEEHDMMNNGNDRKEAIIRMLVGADAPPPRSRRMKGPTWRPNGNGWTDVPTMVERAKTIEAFRRPDGRSSKPGSLRKTMHLMLERLEADGEIEIEMGVGMRGPVKFARLRVPHADAFCNAPTLPKMSVAA